jgi:DNA-binding CsgD family transcriptional regulator
MAAPYGGIPFLLESISSSPHPDEVARAIVEGPGGSVGAACASVLWAGSDKLVFLGSHGYLPTELEGLLTIDLDGDYPLAQAYWEGEPIIVPSSEVEVRYADPRRPNSRWQQLKKRFPNGDHVNAPIHSDGRIVGAFTLNCPQSRPWSSLDIAALDAVSHTLGIWMTHPDSGLPPQTDRASVTAGDLSPRQRRILEMVLRERTNAGIAHALGISLSTVKQEVARTMVILQVPDRHAAAARAADLGLLQTDTP